MIEQAIDPAIPFGELPHCDETIELLEQMICAAFLMPMTLNDRDMASGLLRALAAHFHTFPEEVRTILGSHAAILMLRGMTDEEQANLSSDVRSLLH